MCDFRWSSSWRKWKTQVKNRAPHPLRHRSQQQVRRKIVLSLLLSLKQRTWSQHNQQHLWNIRCHELGWAGRSFSNCNLIRLDLLIIQHQLQARSNKKRCILKIYRPICQAKGWNSTRMYEIGGVFPVQDSHQIVTIKAWIWADRTEKGNRGNWTFIWNGINAWICRNICNPAYTPQIIYMSQLSLAFTPSSFFALERAHNAKSKCEWDLLVSISTLQGRQGSCRCWPPLLKTSPNGCRQKSGYSH